MQLQFRLTEAEKCGVLWEGGTTMKLTLILFATFFLIMSPVFGELTSQDLDKIRLIVKEEVAASEARLRSEIAASEKRMQQYVDTKFETVDTKFESVDKRLTLVVGFVSALIILIVVTVGIPQIIIAWRGSSEREQNKKIEELAREIEELKQKRIVNP